MKQPEKFSLSQTIFSSFCPCCTWLSCSCSLLKSFIAAGLGGVSAPSCVRRCRNSLVLRRGKFLKESTLCLKEKLSSLLCLSSSVQPGEEEKPRKNQGRRFGVSRGALGACRTPLAAQGVQELLFLPCPCCCGLSWDVQEASPPCPASLGSCRGCREGGTAPPATGAILIPTHPGERAKCRINSAHGPSPCPCKK